MRILLLVLSIACLSITACTKDQAAAKPSDAAPTGKGLGGQVVGGTYPSSVGAGDSQTRGTNVGTGASGDR